jgi:hypothetical protein
LRYKDTTFFLTPQVKLRKFFLTVLSKVERMLQH